MKARFIQCLCILMLAQTVLANRNPPLPSAPGEQLIRAFQNAYPTATQVAWREKENGYAVYFLDKTIRSQIDYDLEGNFVSSIRYYQDANLMPVKLVWKLHRKFSGKTVYGVTETTDASGVFYFVKLEGQNDWTTVKATAGGSMRITEKLAKQS